MGRTCPAIPYTKAQLEGMMWRADTNGDGLLSQQELKEGFRALGSHIPGGLASVALHLADRNRDGYISKEESKMILKYVPYLGYKIK